MLRILLKLDTTNKDWREKSRTKAHLHCTSNWKRIGRKILTYSQQKRGKEFPLLTFTFFPARREEREV
jgi:hypothetical protein